MALTVGDYLYRRLVPQAKEVHMNITDVEVLHAQVANKAKGSSQPLALEAHLDLDTCCMSLAWFNVSAETGERAAESFATAVVRFENPRDWVVEWDRLTHLVLGRIEALEQMAAEGKASRLSKSLAYTLFKNVVDYADRYRGMDSVVLHEYEAFADITLIPERHGTWHTPPHWIDSVSHIGGLIMNGSDASNTRDFFYVTPGCDSFRLLNPLEPNAKYRSYVRMFPLPPEEGEGNMYAGDVYILQDDKIVGMVGKFKFRRVPRLLMDRFFSPSDSTKGNSTHTAQAGHKPPAQPVATKINGSAKVNGTTPSLQQVPKATPVHNKPIVPAPLPSPTETTMPNNVRGNAKVDNQETPGMPTPAESEADSGVVGQCLQLIANETGLDISELSSDATFVQLGIDSLMSLVLSEKFRTELSIEVKSSLFLECPTIGDMKTWLEQYC